MQRSISRFTLRSSLFLALSLVAVTALLGSAVPLVSSWTHPAKKSGSKLAKYGAPYLNLQDSRELETIYSESSVNPSAVQFAGADVSLLSRQARPLTLASGDFDADGFADLICGYALPAGGMLTLRRGSREAFAPEDPAVLRNIANGQFPEPFQKKADVFSLPEAPDFIATGDFNRDGSLDVAVAARASSVLYLLPGDKRGGFAALAQVTLPGAVTAMMAGDINGRDGLTDLVVGTTANDESAVLVFDSTASILGATPSTYALPAEAKSLAAGDLDGDRYRDIAILSGNKIIILHGRDSTDVKAPQLETVALPYGARAIALGDFISDRNGRTEIAVMSEDGGLHIAARGQLDTRPMTAEDVQEGRRNLIKLREKAKKASSRGGSNATVASPPASLTWEVVEDLPSSSTEAVSTAARVSAGGSQPVLLSTRISALPSDDLVVIGAAKRDLQVIYADGSRQGEPQIQSAKRTSVALQSDEDVVAVLPMRVNVDSRPGLVVLKKGKNPPSVFMPMAAMTFHVTRTDDPSPDGCAIGDCSLREAIIDANANAGADTIVFDLNGTFTLSITSGGSFDNNAATGDLDINDSVSIVGNGSSNTVISTSYTSGCGDCKVFGVNQDGVFSSIAVSLSGLTIQNGFNDGTNNQFTFTETGGGIDFFMTGSGNSHSMTNCVVTNNTATGSPLSHGGGVNVDSFNTASVGGPSAGTVTLTGCTVSNNTVDNEGGGLRLAADLHDVDVINCSVSTNQTTGSGGAASGGGIDIAHSFGGTVTITGGSVSNNTAAGPGGGVNITFNPNISISNLTVSGNTSTTSGTGSAIGGGVSIVTTGLAGFTPTISLSGTIITSNHADNGSASQGGGVYFNSFYDASLSSCSVGSNTSRSGAGVFNGGSSATPQATLTFGGGSITGNIAAASGGGVGTASASTTISNTTITGNSAVTSGGGLFAGGGTLNVSLSRIANNTAPSGSGIARTAGTATVENNWWGCDGFPNSAGCQTGSGVFDADPRIDLRLLPASATLAPGGTQGFTADVSQNSNGASINPVVLNGLTITFGNTAGLGSVAPGSAPLSSLTASTTFTANSTCPSPNTGTVSATLDNGTQTSSVTVQQATAISACPADQTVSNDPGQCSASVTFVPPTATAGCPTATVTCKIGPTTITSPHTFPVGMTTVTCTASNGSSPDQSCSFNVTVNDTQPPSITCPSNITTTGTGCSVVTYTTPTPTDNCPGATVNCSPASGFCFPVGTTTVTCTATDASLNTASCTFTVTVQANCTITCPSNISTGNNPNQCGAVVTFAPATTAGCGTVNCTPASGSFFPVGTTSVNCTTTAGPSCSFTVTVNDVQPPTIVCPANVTATAATGQTSAIVTYPAPTVSDNCPGATAVCAPASGSSFPLGTTTVTCTATDAHAHQSSCSFTVRVNGSFLGTADSFIRDGADDTNEGANDRLRIQSSGHNRVLVRFNLSGVSTVGLVSATLVLNIADNSDNWGPTGRLVDAQRLLADWTEGNGHTVGSQPNFRGTGEGVTWSCAKDTDIANHSNDCVTPWNGGAFAAPTAAPVLHTNNQTGDVSWDVTLDVAGATNGWIVKKQNEGQNGQVRYYSREGAVAAGNPNLGPRLVLVYGP